MIADTTADSSGHWSVTDTFAPLFDGAYTMNATATAPAGLTTGSLAEIAPQSVALAGLVVDTPGPVVQNMIFDRAHGLLYFEFQDGLSGLDRSTLMNPNNYRISAQALAANVPVLKSLVVTNIAISPPTAATDPVVVVITINGGKSLRGGLYTFDVVSGGIKDLAGNGLGGNFTGAFPSGGGLYPPTGSSIGSDFIAEVVSFQNTVSAPMSVSAATKTVKLKTKTVHVASALTFARPIVQAPASLLDAALAAVASSPKKRHKSR